VLTTVRLYDGMYSPHTYYVPENGYIGIIFGRFPPFEKLMEILKNHYKDAPVRPRVSVMDSSGVYRDLNYQALKDPENGVNISL
jgi:hypothetical protein